MNERTNKLHRFARAILRLPSYAVIALCVEGCTMPTWTLLINRDPISYECRPYGPAWDPNAPVQIIPANGVGVLDHASQYQLTSPSGHAEIVKPTHTQDVEPFVSGRVHVWELRDMEGYRPLK